MSTPLSPQVLQLRATAHLHAQRPPICAVCAASAPGLAAERRYGSPTASAGAVGDADGARPMAYSTPTQPRGGGARAATFGDALCLDGPRVPASTLEYPIAAPGRAGTRKTGRTHIAKDGGEQCALACKARQTLTRPAAVCLDGPREGKGLVWIPGRSAHV